MEIDDRSWKLLSILQTQGRVSMTELAGHVALSVPATSDRVRRLEDAGVIIGYRALVAPEQVGYGLMALIGITASQADKARLLDVLRAAPEVLECHHVTGQDSFILKVIARDVRHLEAFIAAINPFGETRTSIVLSTPIESRSLQPPPVN